MASAIEHIDELIARTVAGQPAAWTRLASHVHRAVLATCASIRGATASAFLGDGELEHEVAMRVLDRLKASDYRALVRYAEVRERYRGAQPDASRSFDRWLSVVTRRLRIDYLRSLPEYRRVRRAGGRETEQVAVGPLVGDEPGPCRDVVRVQCDQLDVRRIVDALEQPGFPAHQRTALLLWLRGFRADEIAGELGLADALAAQRLLRAARQRLRRLVPGQRDVAVAAARNKRSSK